MDKERKTKENMPGIWSGVSKYETNMKGKEIK